MKKAATKKVQAQIPLAQHRRIVDLAKQEHSTVRNVVGFALGLGLKDLESNPAALESLPRDGRHTAAA